MNPLIITTTFHDDTTLHMIADPKHEFLLTTKEVALGYGTTTEVIRQHQKRNSDEFVEGKHFLRVTNSHAQKYGFALDAKARRLTLWTKRGIIRLGFFIRSSRARKFRDWCEDLILSTASDPTLGIPNVVDELDQEFFRRRYGAFNPTGEFVVVHGQTRAYAYACTRHGFLISSRELARLLGVSSSTLRVLKNYHKNTSLIEGVHHVTFSSSVSMWTREGAAWLALHSGDGTFASKLFDGKVDSLRQKVIRLRMQSQQLIDNTSRGLTSDDMSRSDLSSAGLTPSDMGGAR